MRQTVIFLLSVSSTVIASFCNSNEFECSFGGRCIYYTSVCDGYYDCGLFDSSDESNCVCYSDEYKCSNGYCIPQHERCDGYNDCWDNSDEYCSTSGGAGTGLIVGVTIVALCILVLFFLFAVGGGSYKRSRRRRLMRTAPVVTVHSPPPVATITTAQTIPQNPRFSSEGVQFDKNSPPPYSAVVQNPSTYPEKQSFSAKPSQFSPTMIPPPPSSNQFQSPNAAYSSSPYPPPTALPLTTAQQTVWTQPPP